jgi:hypothetical protein
MLELFPPRQHLLRCAFHAYLHNAVPWLAARRKTERLLDYTWTTILRSAAPPQVLDALRGSGFEDAALRSFAQVLCEYTTQRI